MPSSRCVPAVQGPAVVVSVGGDRGRCVAPQMADRVVCRLVCRAWVRDVVQSVDALVMRTPPFFPRLFRQLSAVRALELARETPAGDRVLVEIVAALPLLPRLQSLTVSCEACAAGRGVRPGAPEGRAPRPQARAPAAQC